MAFMDHLAGGLWALTSLLAAQPTEGTPPPGATWADLDAIVMLALGLVAVGAYLARR